jgi:hypothetical protein
MPGPGRPKNRGKKHKQTVIRTPSGGTMIIGRGLPTKIVIDFFSGNVTLRKESEITGPDGAPAEVCDTSFDERRPYLLQSVLIPLSRKLAEYLVAIGHDLNRVTIVLDKPPPLPAEVEKFQQDAIREIMERNIRKLPDMPEAPAQLPQIPDPSPPDLPPSTPPDP